jgi:hypothetical protein
MTDKPIKIEFAPGSFDQFEGTQEELDQLLAEIYSMFENKSPEEIAEMSRPLTEADFDELPEEVQRQLARAILDPEDQALIPQPKTLQ